MNIWTAEPDQRVAIRSRVLDALITIVCFDTSDEFRQLCKRRFNEINMNMDAVPTNTAVLP